MFSVCLSVRQGGWYPLVLSWSWGYSRQDRGYPLTGQGIRPGQDQGWIHYATGGSLFWSRRRTFLYYDFMENTLIDC